MRRRFTSAAALVLASALGLAACGGGGADPDVAVPSFDDCDESPNDCNSGPRAEGGEITWLINQGWDSNWNQMTTDGFSVYSLLAMQGVLPDFSNFQPDGTWAWDMDLYAEEPEMISESPQTLVYRIRDEAVWSDGTPISVDDFIYAWHVYSGHEEHCVGCTPPGTSGYANLASIEGSDEGKTVTITYEDGVTDPEWFARYGPGYPAHVARDAGYDLDTPEGVGESMDFFINNVPDWSGGPYLIERATADELVVMVPNPAWYGEIQPTFERINKVVISDQGAWVPALRNEEIHGGWPASWTVDFAEQLKDMPGIMSIIGSGGGIWEHVDANLDSLDDVELRRAIFTAIDTEHARTAIWGEVAPPLRTNHVFPAISPHHEDHLTGTGYGTGDAEKAREILAAAGYTGFEEGGELTDPDGEPVPPVRFAFLSGNQNRATFVELAQSYLADIGITVEPEATPGDQLGTLLTSADYDLVIFGWVGQATFTNAPNQYWHSASGGNFGGLDNPQVDELTQQVLNQVHIEDSARLANEAVQLVMEEAYVLPLWDNPEMVFVSDRYINIRPNFSAQENALYNQQAWGLAATQ